MQLEKAISHLWPTIIHPGKVQLQFTISYSHLVPSPSFASIISTITPSPPPSHNPSKTALSVLKYLTEHRHHLPSKAKRKRKKKHLRSLDTFCMSHSKVVFWGGERENIVFPSELVHYLAAQNAIWKTLFCSNNWIKMSQIDLLLFRGRSKKCYKSFRH